MKCDSCKFRCGQGPTLDYPHPTEWCGKGHWDVPAVEDCPQIDDPDRDPWVDCDDFDSPSACERSTEYAD